MGLHTILLLWLKYKTTYYINTTRKKPQIIFMSISTVYKIINDIDDKVYIGSTTSKISKRITEHRRRARRGETTKFYQHMRNIGIECFKIVCIKEYTDISKEILHKKEDKYIRRFDSVRNGLNTNAMSGYYCMHGTQKRLCRECDMGKNLCIHDKVRYMCVECKGKGICIHDKLKYLCVECKGKGICIHDKIKHCCKLCNPVNCDRCGKTYAGKQSLRTHQKNCQIDQSNITE